MGLIPTCIFGFGFYFPGGSLGGTLGDFFCRGYVGTFSVHCPKRSLRVLIARSCSSQIRIGVSSSPHVSVCNPWRTQSSGVRVGCVR